MVHFPASLLMRAMCSRHDGSHPDYRVTPFGHPRIVGRWHLPAAFRSYPRPSSSGSSQASSVDPYSLDHIILPFPFAIDSQRSALEAQGLEPWTLGLQSRCSSQLSHAPMPSWAIGKRETPSRPYIAGPSPAGATLLFSAPPAVSPMALPFFLERR